MSYKLQYPYTEEQRANFIVEYNHNQGLRIETFEKVIEEDTETKYLEYFALEPFEKLVNGEVIDNTEEYEAEKAKQEAERIGKLTCTKRVFALMLQELGITYTQLKQLISTNEQAELEWDLCVELERKNPLLDIMASQLGITPIQLDGLFMYANGEITLEEFKGFAPVKASESNAGVEADE